MNTESANLSNIVLTQRPTPLIKANRMGASISKKLYFKRDDLLGRVLGGNKLRKLEYILPLAQKSGADTLITTGSFESNHVCLTVAAAKMLNMNAAVVLMGPKNDKRYITLNERLQKKIGANIRLVFYDEEDAQSRSQLTQKVDEAVAELTSELKNNGKNPYFVPGGGCCLEGTFAFVKAFEELHKQMNEYDFKSYNILLPVGTGSTFAGLWCGIKKANASVNLYGVSIARKNPRCVEETIKAAERVCSILKISKPSVQQFYITDDYIGDGYGKSTELSKQAVDNALVMEGLLLDNTYTGKALGGMIDMVSKNIFNDKPLVFWHTGGVSGAIDNLFIL